MNPNRRDFLKVSLGLAAACAAGNLAWSQEKKTKKKGPRKIPIGLQLYTVRGAFTKDVPGTLKKVAELGYRGVEFWGYNGTPNIFQNYSAQQLRQILDENKLRCCGIHTTVGALKPENLERTVANNKTLGNRFLNVASAGKEMESAEEIKKFAAFMNETSEKLKAEKMFVGYHAHGADFKKIGDQSAWELLFSQVNPAVNMQIDIGNTLEGGGDPIAMLKKFPGRVRTVHLKTYADKTFESDYFKEVFQLLETLDKPAWYIAEEGEKNDGFDGTEQKTIETLRSLGK